MGVQPSNDKSPAKAGLPTHEVVYRKLRDMVLFGELQPGQAVTIQGLTESLGVGMTPVREALRRLTAEGALAFLGNRRIVVPQLDLEAIRELSIARKALEPELARRAAERATDEDIAFLRETDARLDSAILNGDVHGYLVENHRFHARINQLADSPILTDIVEGLWLRFGPSLRIVCGQWGTRNLPDRHKDLLKAMEDRNPQRVAEAMEADVEQGMEQIRRGIR